MRNFHPRGREPRKVAKVEEDTDRSFIVRYVPAGTIARLNTRFSYMPTTLTDAQTPHSIPMVVGDRTNNLTAGCW